MVFLLCYSLDFTNKNLNIYGIFNPEQVFSKLLKNIGNKCKLSETLREMNGFMAFLWFYEVRKQILTENNFGVFWVLNNYTQFCVLWFLFYMSYIY